MSTVTPNCQQDNAKDMAPGLAQPVDAGKLPTNLQNHPKGHPMLILTRRVGETIIIGEDVAVTVLGVQGNQVRVGVNAPKEVSVHREEIYERIQQEKQAGKAANDAS